MTPASPAIAIVDREFRVRDQIEHRNARNGHPQAVKQEAPRLRIYSASELDALEFSPLRFTVPGLFTDGVYLVAGKPKLGKSWLMLNIGIAVASGGYALGTIKIDEPGDVLLGLLEDGPRRVQQRMRKALRGSVKPENLYFATEWRTFDSGGLEDAEEWISSRPNPRLMVFDTLERVRPREDPKARLYHNDYAAIQGLQDLAKRHQVCIVVIHHTRKADANDVLDLASGSTGLTGACDGVGILSRARGEPDAVLTVSARDFQDTELALKFDSEICDWRALGDAAEYKLSNERRDVIDLLRREPGLKPKEISTQLKRDYGATKKLLFEMRQADQVHSDSKGCYSLVTAGIPGNSVTAGLPENANGNRSGNPKNSEKASNLPGNNAEGYPVTTVTGVIEEAYFPPEASDEEIDQIYRESALRA